MNRAAVCLFEWNKLRFSLNWALLCPSLLLFNRSHATHKQLSIFFCSSANWVHFFFYCQRYWMIERRGIEATSTLIYSKYSTPINICLCDVDASCVFFFSSLSLLLSRDHCSGVNAPKGNFTHLHFYGVCYFIGSRLHSSRYRISISNERKTAKMLNIWMELVYTNLIYLLTFLFGLSVRTREHVLRCTLTPILIWASVWFMLC